MRAQPVLRTAALIAVLAPSLLPAQSVGRMLETDLRNFGGDVWAVWTSPFRAGPKDWLTAGLLIGASAAATPLDDDIDRWMVRHRNNFAGGSLKELREGGLAFSGKYITPIAAGALIYGLATKNTKIQEGIFGCLASYASGSVVRNYVIYPLISRERPAPVKGTDPPPAVQGDQYKFAVPGEFDNWGQHSMPAGHAANILSCASFLNNRFDMGLVEPALYLISAGVGVGRLVDRRHWNSDTMIGMAFGYAIGRQISHRSLNRAMNTQSGAGSAAASVLSGTYLSPSKTHITLGWKTTF